MVLEGKPSGFGIRGAFQKTILERQKKVIAETNSTF